MSQITDQYAFYQFLQNLTKVHVQQVKIFCK